MNENDDFPYTAHAMRLFNKHWKIEGDKIVLKERMPRFITAQTETPAIRPAAELPAALE